MTISAELIKEIKEVCDERGNLSAKEIAEVFGVEGDDYKDLRERLSSEACVNTSHSEEIKISLEGRSGESAAPDMSSMPQWQKRAVDMLADKLSNSDLEKMLGSLSNSLQVLRNIQSGGNKYGNRKELAFALVSAYGEDLLKDSGRRKVVASAFGIKDSSGNWSGGGSSERTFVEKAGLPSELAGNLFKEKEAQVEVLRGKIDFPPLMEFQRELKKKILKTMIQAGGRGILSLPVAAGKTRTMVESVMDYVSFRGESDHTVIWLTSSWETCARIAQCFREVWENNPNAPRTEMIRFWGKYAVSINDESRAFMFSNAPKIIISTVQDISKHLTSKDNLTDDFMKLLFKSSKLMVIAESNQDDIAAYTTILSRLESANPNTAAMAVTTMDLDNISAAAVSQLKNLFKEQIDPGDILAKPFKNSLKRMKVLSSSVHVTFKTPLSISIPTSAVNGRLDYILKILTDRTKRRAALLPEIQKRAQLYGSSILYYGPSDEDAASMAFMLKNEGIAAETLTSETDTGTRYRILNDFKKNAVKVICCHEVMTAGFDSPKVTHVIAARPTVSRTLYEQMIGNALKGPRFGGAESVEILDCRDDMNGTSVTLGWEKYRS